MVGRGITTPPGQAHAEIVAIEDAGDLARGSDMYVTLEPCCHWGKTQPCTDAIIRAGIARVFVGSIDPNPLVCGEGIRYLNEKGVTTTLISDDACEQHLDPFRKFIQTKTPWVHLKVASTVDGQLATLSGDSKWITGAAARLQAHRLRAQSDALLVGIGTVLADDPRLTVRDVPGSSPTVVILDSMLRVPLTAQCIRPGTLVFHRAAYDESKAEALRNSHGVVTIQAPEYEHGLDLNFVLSELATRHLISVMVEGGGKVLSTFLKTNNADELSVFIAPKLFGMGRSWSNQPLTDLVSGALVVEGMEVKRYGDDLHLHGRLKRSEETQ